MNSSTRVEVGNNMSYWFLVRVEIYNVILIVKHIYGEW